MHNTPQKATQEKAQRAFCLRRFDRVSRVERILGARASAFRRSYETQGTLVLEMCAIVRPNLSEKHPRKLC